MMNDRDNKGLLYAERMKNIITLNSVSSTNLYLKELKDAPHGTVVSSLRQTSGRGRGTNSFYSPENEGVYMSYLLRNQTFEQLNSVTPRCAVAVKRALERACGIGAAIQIKWVNDLLINNKKVCGILSQAVFENGDPRVIVGIGINVLQKKESFPQDIADKATSLLIQTEKMFDINSIMLSVVQCMDEIFDIGEDCFEEYERNCLTIGKRCKVITENTEKTAVVLGLNRDYSLSVRYDDGRTENVNSGQVSIRGFDGYF